jgi:hypothetical protein
VALEPDWQSSENKMLVVRVLKRFEAAPFERFYCDNHPGAVVRAGCPGSGDRSSNNPPGRTVSFAS